MSGVRQSIAMTSVLTGCPACRRLVQAYRLNSGADAPRIHYRKCPICGHEWSDAATPETDETPEPGEGVVNPLTKAFRKGGA